MLKNTILATIAALGIAIGLLTTPASAVAADQEPTPDVVAVMGPEQEYQYGLEVNGVAPTLRSIVVGGESILAYCIEYWIRAAAPDHEAAVTPWEAFTGDNHFTTDPHVRHQVAWILRNSYPTIELAALQQHTNTADLTAAEAIAATQAAIWHYTDDFAPDGALTVADAPQHEVTMDEHSQANVQAVFQYLTGQDNTGLKEREVQASVTLVDATEPAASIPEDLLAFKQHDDDHLFGPIMLNASTNTVELEVHIDDGDDVLEELSLLDAQGVPLDTDQPVAAEAFWVHVPAETPDGTIRLAAESTDYGYSGRLIIPEPDAQRRFQTIVVVDQTTDQASTDLTLTWEQMITEDPPTQPSTPAEPPEEQPQEPLEVESTPSIDADPPVESQPDPDPASELEPEPAPDPEAVEPNPVATKPAAPSEMPTSETDKPEPPQASSSATATPQDVADETEELAVTGAHETRNILVALGTVALGALLVFINRCRRRRI